MSQFKEQFTLRWLLKMPWTLYNKSAGAGEKGFTETFTESKAWLLMKVLFSTDGKYNNPFPLQKSFLPQQQTNKWGEKNGTFSSRLILCSCTTKWMLTLFFFMYLFIHFASWNVVKLDAIACSGILASSSDISNSLSLKRSGLIGVFFYGAYSQPQACEHFHRRFNHVLINWHNL